MPLFSYRCTKCNTTFDHLEGVIASPEELKCPKCGNKEVVRQVCAFSVGGSSDKGSPSSCPTCHLS